MISIKNILQFKPVRVFTLLLLIIYVFLLGGKELFHNHESELFEPNDCPVYLLNSNFESYNTDFLSANLIHIFSDYFIFDLQLDVVENISFNNSLLRAPPIFS